MSAEDIEITCPSSTCYALVADGGGVTTIASINLSTKSVVSSINLPVSSQGITVTPGGQVLVNSFDSNVVRVVSMSASGVLTDTGKSVTTGGTGALNVTVSPDGKTALVANLNGNSVGVLQVANDGTVSFVKAVPAIASPQSIAFTHDGQHAYVLLSGGKVAVLNLDGSNNVTDSGTRITVAGVTPQYYGVDQIAVTVDGKVLVRVVGAVIIIDAATNTVVGSVPVPGDGGDAGGIAVIP
jgi:DNA-binding beta-propeller fold protein YncE